MVDFYCESNNKNSNCPWKLLIFFKMVSFMIYICLHAFEPLVRALFLFLTTKRIYLGPNQDYDPLIRRHCRHMTCFSKITGDHLLRARTTCWIWLILKYQYNRLFLSFQLMRMDQWFVTCYNFIPTRFWKDHDCIS